MNCLPLPTSRLVSVLVAKPYCSQCHLAAAARTSPIPAMYARRVLRDVRAQPGDRPLVARFLWRGHARHVGVNGEANSGGPHPQPRPPPPLICSGPRVSWARLHTQTHSPHGRTHIQTGTWETRDLHTQGPAMALVLLGRSWLSLCWLRLCLPVGAGKYRTWLHDPCVVHRRRVVCASCEMTLELTATWKVRCLVLVW